MISYGFVKEVNAPFDQVLERLPGLLEKQGFGVISKIDLGQKLRKSSASNSGSTSSWARAIRQRVQGIDSGGKHRPYASCNVIVYEKEGRTTVATIRPSAMMRQ